VKNNVFLMLVIGLLVWGGTVGAAFAGGVTVGKSKAEPSTTSAPSTSTTTTSTTDGSTASTPAQSQAQPPAQSQTQTQPQAGTQDQQNLRQQLNGGTPLTQEQLDALRQQLQNRQGGAGTAGAGGQGFALRGGLQGTVEQVNGNTISINTAQGTLQATLTTSTQINAVTTGKPADIAVGAEVIVTGQRAADGTTQAASVFIVPQGFAGLPGLGGVGGGRGGAGAGGATTGGA